MGLLSWLFPSPADRVASGQAALASKRWRDAKDLVDGIEGPEAAAVRAEAGRGLVRLNLQHVVDWAEAGEDERIEQHFALVDELHPGGMEEEIRAARRQVREIRVARKEADQKKRDEQVRQTQVDPLGLTGRSLLRDAGPGPLPEATEEQQQRLALIVENYPPDLRATIGALGPSFAEALLDLEDGRPDLALQVLSALPASNPLVCFERARCAWALNDPKSAMELLRAFATSAGGHRAIGPDHTAMMLVQLQVQSGDLDGAVRVLRDARVRDPSLGGAALAELLFATGSRDADATRFVEAESLLRDVILKHPKQPDLYALLARVRIAGGHRVPAMRAYEDALTCACGSPGSCGTQPPDPGVQRALATLYLEDGIERPRALELADAALAKAQTPTWEDVYLEALVARATAQEDDAAASLWEGTPEDDPRRARLQRYLPLSA